jgi:hypothetical protein
MNGQKEEAWREAQRRCRLSDEEVRMAKELGFQPKSLVKNIPSPSQRWKAPVNEWVRSLYEQKIGSKKPAAVSAPAARPSATRVVEFRNADNPWPDHPEIPDLPPVDMEDDLGGDVEEEYSRFEPPSSEDIDEQSGLLLRRQRLFRWAAQSVAVAVSELSGARKVAAFGAVARPVKMEIPRFRQFRRLRIKVFHECTDLDLAIWMNDFADLKSVKKAINRGLRLVQDTPYGGVAHHQVDVHLFDASSGDYRGRLCNFGECPKPGKRECRVPGCGADPFLRQFADYRFNPGRFGESKVILFDRDSGFLVRMPRIEGQVREVKWREREDIERPFLDDDGSGRDVPF